MTTTVIANGHTYTSDDNPSTGMGVGGFRERLMPMLNDVMLETNASRGYADNTLASANSAAQAAAISAASAIGSPNTNGTSSTSLAISNASKTLTASTGKSWVVGMWLTLASSSAPSTSWMNGAITAYNSTTGALTVAVTRSRGTGSVSNWVISASAPGVPDAGGALQSYASVFLSASSVRYQAVTPSSSGFAALVPLPTGGAQGPGVFVIRNDTATYGYDLLLANSNGTPLGYVPPEKEVSTNSVGSNMDLGNGGRSYGSPVLTSITFSSVVAGTGLFTKSLLLPSGDTLILVHGVNLHAIVYSAAAGAFGTPVQIRAGLVAAGDDYSVTACLVNDGSDNVVVSSVNGTALQTVLLAISGAITLGTVLSTTLTTAWTKVLDIQPAGTASNRFMLLGLTSATSAVVYGLELTGTTLATTGATSLNITASIAVLLPRASDNVITLLVAASATQVTARPYTVGAGGSLTLGTLASLVTTAVTFLAVRYDAVYSQWLVMHVNTTARVAALTVSATPAAVFSAATVFQSAVTTLNNAYSGGEWPLTDLLTIAVTGTNAAGRSLVEVWQLDGSTGTPTAVSSAVIYMDATPIAAYLGSAKQWQISSSSEAVLFMPFTGATDPLEWRMPGGATYAQLVPTLDNTDIKATKARGVLRGATKTLAVIDGLKPSMQYSNNGWAEATSVPVRLVNNSTNSRNLNGVVDRIWVASGPNPSLTLTIQCLHVV